MRRLQLYLDESTYAEAKLRAAKLGKPLASMVREAMAEYLAKEPPAVPLGEDPIDKIAGIVKGGPSDLSTRVDEIVYGASPGAPLKSKP